MKTLPRIIVLLSCVLVISALCSAQVQKGTPPSVGERSEGSAQALDAGAVRSKASLEAPTSALKMLSGGPLRFEKNAGQFDSQVKFVSRGLAHSLFLTPREAVLVLTRQETSAKGSAWRDRGRNRAAGATSRTVARFKLAGANAASAIEGEDLLPGRSNYLIGRDQNRWHTGVENFSRVRYREIYPGVDWVYYGNEGRLEYDFVVSPGSDPSQIAMEVALDGSSGKEPFRINSEGDIILATQPEGIRFHRPIAYQQADGQKQLVSANYVIKSSGRVGFELGPYDPSRAIIIDPVLNFSTYLGGSSGNTSGFAVAVDATGIYVAGQTVAGNFPTTAGAFRTTAPSGAGCVSSVSPSPCFDAFVSKLSSDGTTLIYSTFLGGSSLDGVFGLAVDGAGEAYVVGETTSNDFPVLNAFQSSIATGTCQGSPSPTTYNCEDAFAAVLKSDGTGLIYSTYLGGTRIDFGNAIAVDSSNNFYVAGATYSANFPATIGTATGGTCGAAGSTFTCGDAFVGKFNPAASGAASLVYLRYLGGQGDDNATSIAVQNSSGSAIVVGETTVPSAGSNTFPANVGGFQQAFGGGFSDGFITKISSNGASIQYSSYIGGNDEDQATGVALDSTGKAFVSGYTISTNLAVKNAVQTTLDGSSAKCSNTTHPCFDAMVAKVDTSLTLANSLAFLTYLGGSDDDRAVAIAVDGSGNPVVSGGTATPQTGVTKPYPMLTPLQSTKAGALGEYDGFVTRLSSAGAPITFSTYFGGGGNFDLPTSIAVGPANEIVIAGRTNSSTFPITLDAFEPSPQGPVDDAFVAKIDAANLPGAAFSNDSLTLDPIGVGFTSAAKSVVLSNMGTASLTISITTTGTHAADFNKAGSSTCGASVAAGSKCQIDMTVTPSAIGARTGFLTVTDNAAGSPHDIALSGTGLAAPAVALTPPSGILAFGSVPFPSTSAPMSVTLTNTGGANLVVSAATVSPSDYTKSADTCTGTPVLPGNTCSVSATFTPSANGPIVGSLTITDTAPGSPRVVALTGTGVSPTASLSTPSLAFGNQLVGIASAEKLVTVTNNGSAALSITNILPTPADYALSSSPCGGTPISIPASGHCDFGVTFTPTATGARNGSLTFTDNAPGNPHAVSLTGTGTVDFTVNPASTSATVNAGATANYTLTLAPLGGFNSTISFSCSGAPVRSTCNAPAATALDGTNSKDVTLSVVTQTRSAAPPMLNPFKAPPLTAPQTYLPWLAAWLMLATTVLLLGKRRRTVLLLTATLAMALAWTACGGGGGGGTTPPPTGTPAGTYTITAMATSGTISKTTTLTLKVN